VRELSNAGFYLIPAANGFEAIKQFATRSIDAVLVNRRLPDISVADLAQYFRLHHEGLPIVMISSAMPVTDAPDSIDAIVQKHHCSTLLVPTLKVLLDPGSETETPSHGLAEAA
ncbi:MAG: response regulator, partial [Terriglobales bacterium]